MTKTQYEVIRQIVIDSGLWQGEREDSHRFILSPEVYSLSDYELTQLKTLGRSLYAVMQGLSRIVGKSEDQKVAKGRIWDIIRRVSSVGIPRSHRRVQTRFPDDYPVIFKVDLLRSGGKFWVVEFDGVNTHGFGYTVLLNRIRDSLISKQARRLRGTVPTIAEYMHSHYAAMPLFLFVSSNSRFYEPYYRIMTKELLGRGLWTTFSGEWMEDHEKMLASWHKLALQFPIFRTDSPLQFILAERYAERQLSFLIPPKTFMGSKSVMALLKNELLDRELEAILTEEIDDAMLESFRSFIPATYLVYPDGQNVLPNFLRGRFWVMKRAISSGSKGTAFITPDMVTSRFLANEAPYQTILQEELPNDPLMLTYYGEEGEFKVDTWFARFTAHYHFGELVDMDITARRDKLVHGAKDCLMFSATLP